MKFEIVLADEVQRAVEAIARSGEDRQDRRRQSLRVAIEEAIRIRTDERGRGRGLIARADIFPQGSMNDYLLSIVLGTIEGLTIFPLARPRICASRKRCCQIDLKDGFWKMFSIVIQLGAILALTVFFGDEF